MSKARKTRQEKIILQLKRKLAQEPSGHPRQEPISYRITPEAKPILAPEKTDKASFSSNPKLTKKDLLKTLALTLFVISLEVVLYLKLR